MRNFGAFVPGLTSGVANGRDGGGDPHFIKSMKEGCGKLLCNKRCLGTADIFWPQVSITFAALGEISTTCTREKKTLTSTADFNLELSFRQEKAPLFRFLLPLL